MTGSTAFFEDFYEALGRSDVPRLTRLLAPDVRHSVYSDNGRAPFEGTFDGREAVVAQLRETALNWHVLQLELLQLEVDGTRAAARVRTHARHRFDQRLVVIEGTHFLELGEDGIAGFDIFFQTNDNERAPAPELALAANEP